MRLFALAVFALAACSFPHGQLGATGDDANAPADTAADVTKLDGDPNVDTDSDGVPDSVDNCRLLANADQRDFDHDNHGDACDHCPHLASAPDPDTDGDGVGDACDPRPSTSGDARALWLGFYDAADLSGWLDGGTGGLGTWSVTGGALVQSASDPQNYTSYYPPGNYHHTYIATQLEVGTAQTGATIGMCSGWNGSSFDCCNINARGGSPVAQAQTGLTTLADTTWPAGITTGETIDVVQDLTSNSNVCHFGTSVTSTSAAAQATAHPLFYAGHMTAKFHYLFIVSIGS